MKNLGKLLEEFDGINQLKNSSGWQAYVEKVVKPHSLYLYDQMCTNLRNGRYEQARCNLACMDDLKQLIDLFDTYYKSLKKEIENADNDKDE